MKHAAPKTYHTVKLVCIAFFVSLLVFGGILGIPFLKTRFSVSPPAEADTVYGRTRRFSLLFYDTVGGFTGAVIVTTDTAARKMETVGYSPTVIVPHDGAFTTLGAVFDTEGADAAAAALADLTGVATEGPLTFSVSNLAAYLVHLKQYLPLHLPQAVGDLPAGDVTLTPAQVADVLRFTRWETPDEGVAYAHAAVVAALFNRYLTPDRDLQRDFAVLTDLCDARLTVSQFESVRGGLQILAAANDGALCSVA